MRNDDVLMRTYRDLLAEHGGTLDRGSHNGDMPDCKVCVLELAALHKLGSVTDDPEAIGLPEVRSINDSYIDPHRRTEAMLGWLVAMDGWSTWPDERQVAWAQIVAMRTVREVLPIGLRAVGATEEPVVACENATDLVEAAAAARAAARAAYAADARTARAAADAAAYAANAAYAADAAGAAAFANAANAADARAVHADLVRQIIPWADVADRLA
jgi:hypothetical protein